MKIWILNEYWLIKAQLGEGAGEDVHEGGLDAKVQPVEGGPAIEKAGGLDT